MSNVIELNDKNFKEIISDEKLTLVDFWASWCGPCKLMGPIVDEIASDYEDRVNVCKLNIDDYESIAAEYDIVSIPTLCMFKNGKLVDRITGLRQKNIIENFITKNL